MFGFSFSHLVIFGIIALIVIGPEQLPEVARTLARFLNELKRATGDFQKQFSVDLDVNKINPMIPDKPPEKQPEPSSTNEQPAATSVESNPENKA